MKFLLQLLGIWVGFSFVTVALVCVLDWIRQRRLARGWVRDAKGRPQPCAQRDLEINQRDLGDEQDPLESSVDIATEGGLGVTESLGSFVKDGRLLALGALHPNDRAIWRTR